MTIKQGEDINKQFNALSDSISQKNTQLTSLEKQFVEKQTLFNSNLSILKQNLDSVGTENTFLKGEVERLKGLVWTEGKAARRHSVFMMVSFTTLIVLGFLISK